MNSNDFDKHPPTFSSDMNAHLAVKDINTVTLHT